MQYKPQILISKPRVLQLLNSVSLRMWVWIARIRWRDVLKRTTDRRDESAIEFGARGERIALRHLKKSGYRIVLTNFTVPVGQRPDGRVVTGEIDIVAYDESEAAPILAFIEVKTRSGERLAAPESAIDRRKRRQIVRAARAYRRLLRLGDEAYRFDVIGIVLEPGERPVVRLNRGYFSESEPKKRGYEFGI